MSARLLEDMPARSAARLEERLARVPGAPAPSASKGRGPSPALVSAFRRAAGDAIAAHAQPKYVRQGVLTVAVDSPAWHHELGFLRADLAKKMHEALGQPVHDVKLVLDKKLHIELSLPATAVRRAGVTSGGPTPPPLPPPPVLPTAEALALRRVAAPLADEPEVHDALVRAMTRWRAR